MNEIIFNINGKIYRLTNENNLNKYDRAVKDAGQGANSSQILAHYDKHEGRIEDENGDKIRNGQFWKEEKERLAKEQQRKEKLRGVMNYAMVTGKYFLIPLVVAYLIYKFGWNK